MRLCLADIIGHPWMNGPIATDDEVRKEFKARAQKLRNEANEKEAEKLAMFNEAQKIGNTVTIDNCVFLSGDQEMESNDDQKYVNLKMKKYDPELSKVT